MHAFIRTDRRAPDQLRAVKITPEFIPIADGSVLIEVGSTRVICNATIEDNVPGFQKGTGCGWVTAEYSMLPRATTQRTPREAARGRVSGRSQEISSAARCEPSLVLTHWENAPSSLTATLSRPTAAPAPPPSPGPTSPWGWPANA
jgi:ribonuclease PH